MRCVKSICPFIYLLFAAGGVLLVEVGMGSSTLVTWEAPEGTPGNSAYRVSVRKAGHQEWNPLFVYKVQIGHQSKMDPLMRIGRIPFRGPVDTSMVNFDFMGTVELKVTFTKGSLRRVVLSPRSYGVKTIRKGKVIRFHLTQNPKAPRKLVLRVNGNWEENCLHILTNPPQENVPEETGQDVHVIEPGQTIPRVLPEGKTTYYFKPGLHNLPRGLWVDYDLGEVQRIDRMDLLHVEKVKGVHFNYGIPNFRLMYRTKMDEGWKLAYKSPKGGLQNMIGLTFPAVSARYVRLVLLGNTILGHKLREKKEYMWLHASYIRELKLYPVDSKKNVAKGRAVDGATERFKKLNALQGEPTYSHMHAAETFFIARDEYTLYLAPGSTLMGAIGADNRNHITIKGRGIINGHSLKRNPVAFRRGKSSLIQCTGGDGITVEGITVLDSPCWGIVLNESRNAVVRHVNFFGSIINADGIHMSAVQNGLIEGCFIRTTDDLFCAYHYGATRNIRMRNCVLWSDGARIVLLGLGNKKGDIEDLTFEDLDILNVQNTWSLEEHGGALHIRATGGNTIHNIRFKNIRFEAFRAPKIASLFLIKARAFRHGKIKVFSAGSVHDILFENVTYPGKGEAVSIMAGEDMDHKVKNVLFKNVRWGGRPLSSATHPQLEIRDFVDDVRFSK